jgi:O-antigen ligase
LVFIAKKAVETPPFFCQAMTDRTVVDVGAVEMDRSVDRATFILFCLLLTSLWWWGGASRADEQAQLLVRLSSVILAAIALLILPQDGFRRVRPILFGSLALAALMIIQLIPIPPTLWSALPGRAALQVGQDPVWRPISLLPDLTQNALAVLIPPFAAIILMASTRSHDHARLFSALLVAVFLSGMLGLIQLIDKSPGLYFYRTSNFGASTGVFANRNHQAAMLALAFPMIGAVLSNGFRRQASEFVLLLGAGAALAIVLLIFLAGSRSGLVLGTFGVIAGVAIAMRGQGDLPEALRIRAGRLLPWLVGSVALVGGAIFVIGTRAEALQRLLSEDVSQELRIRLFRPLLEIFWTYFPFGTGFGSFVELYKVHERFEHLDTIYLNHAHNDLLELAIEGGAPALLLVVVGLIWVVRRSVYVWSRARRHERNLAYARASSVNIGILMLASLADYPLRTPIMAVFFAIFSCILAAAPQIKLREQPSGENHA